MKEYWDIYDINKNKTGKVMERNCWTMAEGDYYISVLGVVRNSEGKFLITQRSETKQWAALWWEVPGGAVKSGETSKEAVIREVKEETGLDVSNSSGGYQFCYHRENKGQNYIVDIYRFDLDASEKDLVLQKDETIDGKFATLEEIKSIAKEGRFLHYESIKKVFEV